MFEVVIAPCPDQSHLQVLELTLLGNQMVSVERYAKTTDPAQCHRCQAFGHTRSYCRRPFVCMKCAGAHPTTACAKTREVTPKCANCRGAHISSYKGCVAFKTARERLLAYRVTVKQRRRAYQERRQQQSLMRQRQNPSNLMPLSTTTTSSSSSVPATHPRPQPRHWQQRHPTQRDNTAPPYV
ncbi:uncharacterized protein DMAD_11051 [Drosophila madeirensis]|uniref:Pre-C2HC domain-containing protein n=1 Tax=Drosophila madeirensis TaxID=30013 RepID=A0AAU9FBS0_DROMD